MCVCVCWVISFVHHLFATSTSASTSASEIDPYINSSICASFPYECVIQSVLCGGGAKDLLKAGLLPGLAFGWSLRKQVIRHLPPGPSTMRGRLVTVRSSTRTRTSARRLAHSFLKRVIVRAQKTQKTHFPGTIGTIRLQSV